MRLYDREKGKFVDGSEIDSILESLRKEEKKIVLTSGTFDLLHIGHAEYLKKAKDQGGVLFVGLDSDKKTRKRKGPQRPIVPESERAGIISYLTSVDFIVLKEIKDKSMHLIKLINPDVLVISETTGHSQEKINKMNEFCGKIYTLEAQSTTSTTARIRMLFIDGAKNFGERIGKKIIDLINQELHSL